CTLLTCASCVFFFFFFSSRRRHTRSTRDWSSDVCSSDLAAWRGGSWASLAAAGGIAATLGWTIRWRPGRLRRRGPAPLALREVLDLIRQAYGASAGWAIGTAEGPFDTPATHDSAELEQRRRGAALVHLASVDGRLHVVRDPDAVYVAAGVFP